MDEPFDPLLHANVPVVFTAVNVDVPQFFASVIEGDGTVSGAATPVPAALGQPFTVCVTVYDPAGTVTTAPVDPLLHVMFSPGFVTVNVDVPHPFTSDTFGVATIIGVADAG